MNHIDFSICGFDGNLTEQLSNSGFEACLHSVPQENCEKVKKKTPDPKLVFFFSGWPEEAVMRDLLQILRSHLLEFEITCTLFIAYRQTLHFVSAAHHES